MKKQKWISMLLSFTLLLTMLPFAITVQAASFSGGNGTETDPYLISNLDELEAFRDYVNAENGAGEFFKLTADIDMSSKYSAETGTSWTPIGNASNRFSGNFDGDSHKICGLYINSTESSQGLFGCVGNDGTVKTLGVDGIVSGDCFVGGIVGFNDGKIENCSNACTVSGDDTGGIAGDNTNIIENCYNTGEVSGYFNVGGVTGSTYNSTIICCYNTGKVSGHYNVGGIIGSTMNDTVTNCYYLKDTANGGIEGADAAGQAEVKTAEEFATQSTFKDWDFDTVWHMDSTLGRPVLQVFERTPEEPVFENGDGTETNPYLIPDLETLEIFRDYINGGSGSGEYFKLTADIDMSSKYSAETGTSWTPIGNVSNRFSGNFDGDGHKISGLYINSTDVYQGLFGIVGENGTVKDLGVDGIVSGDSFVGGVVGSNRGKIENCSNACTVSGNDTGGIAGDNTNIIENCYNTGKISGSDAVGGVVGHNHLSTLKNCYNTGEVSGYFDVGGVTGITYNSTIICCYNTGKVSGHYNVCGIIGSTMNDTVTNCYYLKDTANGGIEGADAAGQAEVKTAEEFATQSTFKDWDFDTVWRMNSTLGRPIFFAPAESTPDPMYTVTIPESVEIGGTATVKAENVSDIPSGSYLSVTLSDSDFTLRTDKGAELSYVVKCNGKQLALGDTVLAVGQGTEQSSSADLKFDLKDGQVIKYSGSYQGSVTFNVSIE